MIHVLGFLAFSLFTVASAQVTNTSKFTNAWLSNYVVGLTYQISWTVGDDRPVSLTISNSTWSQDLASFIPPQTTTSFNWTTPSSLSYLSTYALSLGQNGPSSDTSPPFSIVGPATPQNNPQPQATPQNATSSMNSTILTLAPESTGSGALVATSTYWDSTCGCMKTVVGPGPTSVPGTFNYTMPQMETGTSLPTLAPYLPGPNGGSTRKCMLFDRSGLFGMGFAAAIAAFIGG